MCSWTDAELKWSDVNIIDGYGCLNSERMESNTGWDLIGRVRVWSGVGGVHDVMYSGGNVRSADGGDANLDSCVSSCAMRPIPWAVVVIVLNRWQRGRMDEMAPTTM